MPINNRDSFWNSINAFRETVRNQVNQSIEVMRQFPQWAKSALSGITTTIKQGMQWSYQMLINLPQMLRQVFSTLREKLGQGFLFGVRFMRWLGSIIVEALRNLPEIFRELYNLMPSVLRFFKDSFISIARGLKNSAIGIARAIKHVVMNLPHYANRLLEMAKNALILAKNICIYLYHNAIPLLKRGLNILKNVLDTSVRALITFSKWSIKALSKRLLLGLGMLFGISSVLVEGMAGVFNRFISNTLGYDLANNNVANSLQTILSGVLTGALVLGALSYSFITVALLFPLSLLHHEEAAREQGEHVEMLPPAQIDVQDQDEADEVDEILSQRQAPVVHQFEDERAQNDGQAQQAQAQARLYARANI